MAENKIRWIWIKIDEENDEKNAREEEYQENDIKQKKQHKKNKFLIHINKVTVQQNTYHIQKELTTVVKIKIQIIISAFFSVAIFFVVFLIHFSLNKFLEKKFSHFSFFML